MSSDVTLDTKSDGEKMETALIIATGMLFTNIHDMAMVSEEIIERYPDSSDVASLLKSLACSSHNVSRMVVDVMPDHVREKFDEIWSTIAANMAKTAAMEERGESPLN